MLYIHLLLALAFGALTAVGLSMLINYIVQKMEGSIIALYCRRIGGNCIFCCHGGIGYKISVEARTKNVFLWRRNLFSAPVFILSAVNTILPESPAVNVLFVLALILSLNQ
jgi:hypothetical protein